MPTAKEEEEEQKFFAEQLKQQEHDERKHKMADKHETETKRDSVAGYSGTKREGQKVERPEGASKEAVIDGDTVTEPTQEFGGDGVTPKAEWDEKYKEIKKKQDEFDKKRREKAVEDSGIVLTTDKLKHGEKAHNG